MELQKTIYMADLFLLYKELLTLKQKQICELFYVDNLGLTEIASEIGITRQAVLDTIKKVNTELNNFENKLHLKEKYSKLTNITNGKLREEIIDIINN